jgi:hypothetical protein
LGNTTKQTGTLYYTHLEVGYTTERGERILPNPQWSGPSNQRTLYQLDMQVASGVVDHATNKIIEIFTKNGVRGLFLAFPYFVERHSIILKVALSQNHLVGIHMHENWKAISSNNTVNDIARYIESEKNRIENALGTFVSIFSYGPGIQLDSIGGREKPPNTGSMSDDEKRRLFQAVATAGFTQIQTAREYQEFLPAGLDLISADLVGIPHSFEWHDRRGDLRDVMDKISNNIRMKPDKDKLGDWQRF